MKARLFSRKRLNRRTLTFLLSLSLLPQTVGAKALCPESLTNAGLFVGRQAYVLAVAGKGNGCGSAAKTSVLQPGQRITDGFTLLFLCRGVAYRARCVPIGSRCVHFVPFVPLLLWLRSGKGYRYGRSWQRRVNAAYFSRRRASSSARSRTSSASAVSARCASASARCFSSSARCVSAFRAASASS